MTEPFNAIDTRAWTSAVIGLGYVGLPLVVAQARAGIGVTGFDINTGVIDGLNAGVSHIDDVSPKDLADVATAVRFTHETSDLRAPDVIFICVPTPLSLGKQPNISYIEDAARTVASVLRRGHVVVLESTTYPGTTQEVVLPILEASGLKVDEDFLLLYSPERVDPGNASFGTHEIPRIVGGATERSTEAGTEIYRRFVRAVHPVADARTAEMAKLLENTFRWVNIALVNEMSSIARAVGVDIWDVIEAAATKPFGYMAFYPGPGVGGHCIPLDPFYLQWAARLSGEGTRFIELAESINSRMPQVVAGRLQDALNEVAKPLRGSRILVVGVAYKPNVSDHRESPAIEVMRALREGGATLSYSDPHVRSLILDGESLETVELTASEVEGADAVTILCDHDAIDYALIADKAHMVLDTRNALRRRGLTTGRLRSI